MKKLIINADDFGFSEGHNYGIIQAYTKGVVTSTTIMANMPGFEHAVALAKQHPGLHIGVHLNLTCYRPLTQGASLVNAQGYFKGEASLPDYDETEMLEELRAQIKRVQATGLSFDHFDSHHHIHTQPAMRNVLRALLKEYPYPMRGGLTYELSEATCAIMLNQFYKEQATKEYLCQLLASLEDDHVYDLMCHPAYIDPLIVLLSSYVMHRVEELEILCSDEVTQCLESNHISLVTYSNL